jgi:hypothetical protein
MAVKVARLKMLRKNLEDFRVTLERVTWWGQWKEDQGTAT